MPHEYEFRLVVEHSESFLPLLNSLDQTLHPQVVYYVKPHFRFRDGIFETKKIESIQAVFHDGVWFRWVHSVEKPYRRWSRATYSTFLHHVGNYQDPFQVESRTVLPLDEKTKLYTFRHSETQYRLVFEWEFGTFHKPLQRFDPALLLGALNRYASIYRRMQHFHPPPFRLKEQLTRRPVHCIEKVPEGDAFLYAPKLDGVFGLVFSYRDKIKEKWEGYEICVRRDVTLGAGFVFAAERLENGLVYLLDVYQVRGHDTASFCRRDILTKCLPAINLVEGYRVQTYVSREERVKQLTDPTDGIIIHDVEKDVIFKLKTSHSIDVVFDQGYFILPNGRIRCLEEGLTQGCVYEISTTNGRVLRKRTDRFKGNTAIQLESILKNGWNGPPIEPLIEVSKPPKIKKKIRT